MRGTSKEAERRDEDEDEDEGAPDCTRLTPPAPAKLCFPLFSRVLLANNGTSSKSKYSSCSKYVPTIYTPNTQN